RQVHVAAALAGPDQRALHVHRSRQNRRARVGDSQAAIGVAVEAELGARKIARQSLEDLRDLFGARSAIGVADNNPAHLLANALIDEPMKVLQRALGEFAVAPVAVLAPAAVGVHGVLEIDNDLESSGLQMRDR